MQIERGREWEFVQVVPISWCNDRKNLPPPPTAARWCKRWKSGGIIKKTFRTNQEDKKHTGLYSLLLPFYLFRDPKDRQILERFCSFIPCAWSITVPALVSTTIEMTSMKPANVCVLHPNLRFNFNGLKVKLKPQTLVFPANQFWDKQSEQNGHDFKTCLSLCVYIYTYIHTHTCILYF